MVAKKVFNKHIDESKLPKLPTKKEVAQMLCVSDQNIYMLDRTDRGKQKLILMRLGLLKLKELKETQAGVSQ